jgi:hypothetical protein
MNSYSSSIFEFKFFLNILDKGLFPLIFIGIGGPQDNLQVVRQQHQGRMKDKLGQLCDPQDSLVVCWVVTEADLLFTTIGDQFVYHEYHK